MAAGLVYVIDTATNLVRSFEAETAPIPGVGNSATSVAIAPDGARAYVGVFSLGTGPSGFTAGGSIVLVDTASESVAGAIILGSVPGALALTPDGSRLYVGIQSTFVNTGYGSGFFPGSHVVVVDTITDAVSWSTIIDLGRDGPNWTQQNTAAGIGVTPDRRAVYIAVPRLVKVAVADVNTHAVTSLASRHGRPRPPRHRPRRHRRTRALRDGCRRRQVDHDDGRRHGGRERPRQRSDRGLRRDARACDAHAGVVHVRQAHPRPRQRRGQPCCGRGPRCRRRWYTGSARSPTPRTATMRTVTVNVLPPYVIDAVNDNGGVTFPGRTVLASVLANDTLGGTPATTARVTLSTVSSTAAGITLDAATGSVFVALGTAAGTHTLTYRICEIVDPTNCDAADVTVTVKPFVIDAVNDSGLVPKAGGTAVANVLANDKFAARGRHARQGAPVATGSPRTPGSRSTSPPAP